MAIETTVFGGNKCLRKVGGHIRKRDDRSVLTVDPLNNSTVTVNDLRSLDRTILRNGSDIRDLQKNQAQQQTSEEEGQHQGDPEKKADDMLLIERLFVDPRLRFLWNAGGRICFRGRHVESEELNGCHPGECHYLEQNFKAFRRFKLLQKMAEQFGVEPARIRLVWASAAEGVQLVDEIADMVEEIRALGPLNWPGPAQSDGEWSMETAKPLSQEVIA